MNSEKLLSAFFQSGSGLRLNDPPAFNFGVACDRERGMKVGLACIPFILDFFCHSRTCTEFIFSIKRVAEPSHSIVVESPLSAGLGRRLNAAHAAAFCLRTFVVRTLTVEPLTFLELKDICMTYPFAKTVACLSASSRSSVDSDSMTIVVFISISFHRQILPLLLLLGLPSLLTPHRFRMIRWCAS